LCRLDILARGAAVDVVFILVGLVLYGITHALIAGIDRLGKPQ
jgi:hypothetical protein